ncbi:MAG: peptidylprolyl isomerase [Parvularculaceae bacterium]
MLPSDIALITAICVFVVFWWGRSLPARPLVLALSVLAALVAGGYGVLVDRWQAGAGALFAALMFGVLAVNKLRTADNKTGLPWLSGALFALLAAGSIAAIVFFPIPHLPAPSGSHVVGVRDFELVDESRPGVFAAASDEPRRLLVRVWYPAEKTSSAPRAYFEGKEVEATAAALGRNLLRAPFFFKYLKHVRTNSYQDAPLEVGATDLPVIFFSHGYTSFLGQNTALMEELASQGYVVYSVNHTFDSADVVMPNGDVLKSDPKLLEYNEESDDELEGLIKIFFGEPMARYEAALHEQQKALANGGRLITSANVWLADRLFVHDTLAEGAAPEGVSEIVAASDFSKTGEMGMSYGGSTSGAVCMVDRRCAGGVNLDGGDYHYTPFGKNEPAPFMMFYSDFAGMAAYFAKAAGIDLPDGEVHAFNDFSYERPETAGLRSDVYRLTVKGATHLGISDFSLFMRRPLRDVLFGKTPSDEMIAIQRDFVREFFDKHLRGLSNDFPQDAYTAHAGWVSRDDVSDVREGWVSAHPEDRTVQVMLETEIGEIELALYPERAPISTANFLAYVDKGLFDGASFYRVTRKDGGSAFSVVQGGILGDAVATRSMDEVAAEAPPLPPIEHETTDETGMLNERGVVSFGRLEPGTASSEFFVNIDDNPILDSGAETPSGDAAGYAPFARVLRGMRLLEQIQNMPADAPTAIPFFSGQILSEPVLIRHAYRSAGEAKQEE